MSAAGISVIIPTYNCGQWVTEALDSVLRQTRPAAQIIVVDDGSTDDTQRRLEPYRGRGVECVVQTNQGVSAARNAGIARATGEYIAFLDSDDVWHPKKLEYQCRLLAERRNIAMLGTLTFVWPQGHINAELSFSNSIREVTWKELIVKNRFTTSSIIVRRAMLLDMRPAPFDPALSGPEDHDLWIRISRCWPAANLQMPLTGYRSGLTGLGSRPDSMKVGMKAILEKQRGQQAFKGALGKVLRSKAYAYLRCSCAIMNNSAGRPAAAAADVLRSMALYPLPFGKQELAGTCVRPRILVVAALRMLGLR